VVDLVVFGKVKPLRKQVPERLARRFAVLFVEPSVPKRNYIATTGSAAAAVGARY
jgi:hypothetical protein